MRRKVPALAANALTTIDGRQLCFKGTGVGFFSGRLLIMVLTIITLGIYMPRGCPRRGTWKSDR